MLGLDGKLLHFLLVHRTCLSQQCLQPRHRLPFQDALAVLGEPHRMAAQAVLGMRPCLVAP